MWDLEEKNLEGKEKKSLIPAIDMFSASLATGLFDR